MKAWRGGKRQRLGRTADALVVAQRERGIGVKKVEQGCVMGPLGGEDIGVRERNAHGSNALRL